LSLVRTLFVTVEEGGNMRTKGHTKNRGNGE